MTGFHHKTFRARCGGFSMPEILIAVSVLAVVWTAVMAALVTTARVTKKVESYARTQSRVSTALNQVRARLCMGSAGAMNVKILDSGHRLEFRDPNLGTGVISCFRLQNGNLEYDNDINVSPGFLVRTRGLGNIVFELLPGGSVVRTRITASATAGLNQTRPLQGRLDVYLRN